MTNHALYGLNKWGCPSMLYEGTCTTWLDDGAVQTQPFMDDAQQPFVLTWGKGDLVAISPQAAIERAREYRRATALPSIERPEC